MKNINHISQHLKHWPKRQDFADELSLQLEKPGFVGVERVHKWARSGFIPAGFWCAVIAISNRRGVELDADTLAEWHKIDAPDRLKVAV